MLKRFYDFREPCDSQRYSYTELYVGTDREIRSLHKNLKKKSQYYYQYEDDPILIPGRIYGIEVSILKYEDGGVYCILNETTVAEMLEMLDNDEDNEEEEKMMKTYDSFKDWAYDNGLKEQYDSYIEECEEISEQCVEEGYPSHGTNYELRVENLRKHYPELFEDDEY